MEEAGVRSLEEGEMQHDLQANARSGQRPQRREDRMPEEGQSGDGVGCAGVSADVSI